MARYMRYIIKTPTDVCGHYYIEFASSLNDAIAKAKPHHGFVLDTFQKVGLGYKIVANFTRG